MSPTPPSQTDENKLIMNHIGIHSGVCIHNGIVHKNRDEWTVDDCTECTCQVRPHVLKHTWFCVRVWGGAYFVSCIYSDTHTKAHTLITTHLISH